MRFRYIFLLYFFSQYCLLHAQEQEKKTETTRKNLNITRTNQPPKIDGDPTDDVWKNTTIATDFVEYKPKNGTQESKEYRTEVKALYDDTAVYFLAVMYDPEPQHIAKELVERDNIENDDFFGVFINGFDDRQQSLQFMLLASGVQFDAKQTPDSGDDTNWNAVWNSAAKITDYGWVAEIKIPYFELRFPKKDIQTWGINFFRNIQRHRRELTWSHVDNSKGNFGIYDGTLSGIQNIKTPTRLSFLPYLSTYINHYDQQTTANVNGGMDLKYGINDSFTLDLTLIPDFGQANFDNVVLNLGPFEQQFQENRSFFTEGTELFNKGNLFYSRRVGGNPSQQPTPNNNEEIIKNPERVKLFNAIKLSGRTEKGLGIGIFNAITEKTEATLADKISGFTRNEITEPWANYNVLVLDQRFRGNSSVSFINTNVTRDGSFRDANVSALLVDLTNKKNTLNYSGHIKESIVNNNGFSFGTDAFIGASKISGSHRFGANINARDKKFNIDDLGFTGGNNFVSYSGFYNYRYLQPKGLLNILNYRINVNLTNRMDSPLFSNFGIHQNLEMQNRKFLNFGAGLFITPFGRKDIYEPRTFGRHLNVPSMVNPWIFFGTDDRKKFKIGGYTEIYVFNESGRMRYASEINSRYRFSERFSVNYGFKYDIFRNDIGFAGKNDTDIIMGKRNINTFENSLSSQFTFNEKMMLQLSFRHYVSAVQYHKFYNLNTDGSLQERAPINDKDGTFNFWNMDLRYSWWFAPGSQLTLLYRNATNSYLNVGNPTVKENFDHLFNQPMLNNLSLKITYFLDYNRIKHLLK